MPNKTYIPMTYRESAGRLDTLLHGAILNERHHEAVWFAAETLKRLESSVHTCKMCGWSFQLLVPAETLKAPAYHNAEWFCPHCGNPCK